MSARTAFFRRIRRIVRDRRGSYLVEFAAISLPLSVFLMGGIELGYLAYSKARVEGALREVSRLAATGSATEADLDALLDAQIGSIANATHTVEKRSYKSFGSVAQPEPLVSDVDPLGGTPGSGDCYLDINTNGSWDDDMGSAGLGGSEDIIYYGITVSYPLLFPITAKVINSGDSTFIMEANAVLKNEPFGEFTESTAETECIP